MDNRQHIDPPPRRRARRLLDYVVTAAFLVAVAVIAAALQVVSSAPLSGTAVVLDGDSLQFGPQRVRLEGIDAPEFVQTCTIASKLTDCGRLARNHLRELIARLPVECTGWQSDKYDRLLVRCFAGKTDLNASMVRDGWAVAFGDFELEEADASAAKRGLWQGDFAEPSDWRKEHAGGGLDFEPHAGAVSALFDKASQRILGWFGN